jgi:hypothetical protein
MSYYEVETEKAFLSIVEDLRTRSSIKWKNVEIVLSWLGLDVSSINTKNLQQLEESLKGVDNVIKYLAEKNTIDADEAAVKRIFIDTMFEKRSIILKRIKELEIKENIDKIASEAKSDSEIELKHQLNKLLEVVEKGQNLLQENEQSRLAIQEEITRRREEREDFRERWAIRKSFLERESVSTIIGALLLVLITGTQIIATFTHIVTPQILDNGFLVLLGYFFGQTVAKAASRKDDN